MSAYIRNVIPTDISLALKSLFWCTIRETRIFQKSTVEKQLSGAPDIKLSVLCHAKFQKTKHKVRFCDLTFGVFSSNIIYPCHVHNVYAFAEGDYIAWITFIRMFIYQNISTYHAAMLLLNEMFFS